MQNNAILLQNLTVEQLQQKLLQKTFIQEYLQLQKLSKNLKIW